MAILQETWSSHILSLDSSVDFYYLTEENLAPFLNLITRLTQTNFDTEYERVDLTTTVICDGVEKVEATES
jgi:hypothetical protein